MINESNIKTFTKKPNKLIYNYSEISIEKLSINLVV